MTNRIILLYENDVLYIGNGFPIPFSEMSPNRTCLLTFFMWKTRVFLLTFIQKEVGHVFCCERGGGFV